MLGRAALTEPLRLRQQMLWECRAPQPPLRDSGRRRDIRILRRAAWQGVICPAIGA